MPILLEPAFAELPAYRPIKFLLSFLVYCMECQFTCHGISLHFIALMLQCSQHFDVFPRIILQTMMSNQRDDQQFSEWSIKCHPEDANKY